MVFGCNWGDRLKKRVKKNGKQTNKIPIILIFGESPNDTNALKSIVEALRPELPLVEPRKKPIVLAKGAHQAKRQSNIEGLVKVVSAQTVTHKVISVIAHRDCDDIEPVHVTNCTSLLDEMKAHGLPQPVAATPAYEIEAWWFLWPGALAATRPCWNAIRPRGSVGTIRDPKSKLTSELRPKSKNARCPDYTESDSPRIAANIKTLNLVHNRQGRSDSFEQFARQIVALQI